MSKSRRWITLILALIALLLLGWNLTSKDESSALSATKNQTSTYISMNSNTIIYNTEGALIYRITSDKITYFTVNKVSWFHNPAITTYDEHQVPNWSARADTARLSNDHMLYLYGHVEVNTLMHNSQLQFIKTDSARVSLISQNVTSNDKVIFFGRGFRSAGMKMCGNLKKKTAQLIGKVKTYYEIKNIHQQH
ncbi:LPS export ABC transporter periplasmic protein LptC [Pantoea sp. Nvir]|uniref:LPS export ABC transporter periplasmic protein LptC n=1 Tax=Pantoea sp. Nvir TaxID=2576760 RepID=UPI0027EC3C43|nr:LPS export ABC transporter periplasmic protein LptC [Pantoea sp. Nvir]CAJ0993351.1 Lipopolysaccharide export system protein LptC [Pantoea sp. Nvir]